MTRDELVEAVSREVFARTNRGSPNDGWSGPDDWRIIEKITRTYLDVAGPMIRDHEQVYARHQLLADLYAKVGALWLTQIVPPDRDTYGAAIKDVLALLKESDDGKPDV